MSDSILVRVRLGHFDYARPAAQQTQVCVQVPEVARVSYLLDHRLYGVLREQPWPAVVEAAEREYVSRGVVSDSSSAAARKAVCEWLAVDEHRDALYEAWVADCARRDPVARRLLADLDLAKAESAALRARVEELLVERCSTNEALDDAVQELRAHQERFETLRALCDAAEHVGIVSGGWFTVEAVRRAAAGEALPKPDALTRTFAPTQVLQESDPGRRAAWRMLADHGSWEDPHDSPLHHRYAKGRDLPETGGVQ